METKSLSSKLKFLDFLLLLSGFKLYFQSGRLIKWINGIFRVLSMTFNYMELIASIAILIKRGSWFHWLIILPRSLTPIILHHFFWKNIRTFRELLEQLETYFVLHGRQVRRWTVLGFIAWSIGVLVAFSGLMMDIVNFDLKNSNIATDASNVHQVLTGFLAPFYAIYRTGWIYVVVLFYAFVYLLIDEINCNLLEDFPGKFAAAMSRRGDYLRSIASSRSKLQVIKETINDIFGLLPFLVITQVTLDTTSRLVTMASVYKFKQPLNGFLGDYFVLAIYLIALVLFVEHVWRKELRYTRQTLAYLNGAAIHQEPEDARLLINQLTGSPVIAPMALNCLRMDRALLIRMAISCCPIAVIVLNLLPISEFNLSSITSV